MDDKNIVESNTVDHRVVVTVGAFLSSAVLCLLVALSYLVGIQAALIALFVVLGIVGVAYACRAVDRHMREVEHHKHDVIDREHLRDLTRTAIQNHHSVEYNPSTRTLRTISPMTIANGPLTIKEFNMGGQAGQTQIPSPALPVPFDLADLAGVWTPSPNRLLLAQDAQGLVQVPLDKSWHIALAGPTGGGKSNTLRLLMMQLTLFHQVYFVSPAYAPLKADGTDWRPIAQRLASEPARKKNEIENTLKWVVSEMYQRQEQEQDGDFSWYNQPIYLVIDETKEVFNRFPDGPTYVCDLLRQARQYRIYVILAAQDMLIKNIGGDSGARECYRTSYYFGGDQTTARALLDVKGGVDETGLGMDGMVLLRSLTSPQPTPSRVPFVSNEGLELFMSLETGKRSGNQFERGVETNVEAAPFDFVDEVGNVSAISAIPSGNEENDAGNAIRETVKRMRDRGMTHKEISVLVGLSGRKYPMYQTICREEGIE